MNFEWKNSKVLVTGGASFIGSNLVKALLKKGATVRVIDNLTSGKKENLGALIETGPVQFLTGDLLDPEIARQAIRGMNVVFHLAADHGGRGYVDLHQVECATNLILDGLIFKTCFEEKIEKVVFASSGCVYPNYKQTNVNEEIYLTEDMVGPPYDADNTYGWAKLMGEITLQAYHKQRGLKTASCRYFTVYGPGGVENHAVIAMIARAFLKRNPFEIWGDGTQIRNWTYIDDIVCGTILAAEKIDDGTAVNLGTMERVRVIDAVKEVLRYTEHKAEIKFRPDMPTGPLNRVADNSLAKKLLGWKPEVSFIEGLHRTIDWYFKTKKKEEVEKIFGHMLTER
jgi:nucleoside-diphosphate-sugar epimerase